MFTEQDVGSPAKSFIYAFPSEIRDIAEVICGAGREAYIVGGAVRDLLLGREFKDVDIVVDGDAVSLAERISNHRSAKYFVMNDKHSTVRVLVRSESFGDYTIDISTIRHSILNDLTQRDFTCNALAVPIDSATQTWHVDQIIDNSGGISDLFRKRLTALSEQSFREDPLRLMRAFRIAAQLKFTIDERTFRWIGANSLLVSAVASERIRDELLRIVGSSQSSEFLELMADSGLLDPLMPELTDGRGVKQPVEHQSDVLTHNLRTPGMLYGLVVSPRSMYSFAEISEAYSKWREALLTEDFSDGYPRWNFLALAGLLHDVGKPATKTTEAGGRIRFLNHGFVGSDLARGLLERLRFSSKAINFVTNVIKSHMRPSQMYVQGSMPTRKATYRYHRDLGGIAEDVLFVSLADYQAAVQEKLDPDYWHYRCTITDQVLNWNRQESTTTKARYVDGHDIIEEFSLVEGPVVGRLLALLDEAVALGTVRSREQALLYLEQVQVKLRI